MEENTTFQEMKAQLHLLKEKLNKQNIINERIMQRAIKEKASKLRRRAYAECIGALILIGYFGVWPPHFLPLSIELRTFVCLFLLLVIACNVYILYTFNPQKIISESLIEARRQTIKLKQTYSRWLLFFGIPFILIFVKGYVSEICQHFIGDDRRIILASVATGIAIGLCIGLYIHFKNLRYINSILQQIREMEEDA